MDHVGFIDANLDYLAFQAERILTTHCTQATKWKQKLEFPPLGSGGYCNVRGSTAWQR